MDSDWEQPDIVVRCSRTPRTREHRDRTIRESLLSESTSGFVKGDDDTTSVATSAFSSPELDSSVSATPRWSRPKKLSLPSHQNIEEELQHMQLKDEISRSVATEEYVVEKNEKQQLFTESSKVPIPDGGWGWVVVLSSFIISMIADGISFSFGLLYIEFLEEFQASKSTTAWIGSLFIAVPLLSGPVMSALVEKYGCRKMTILGGLISTLGFMLASISTSLEMMMITFGVISGLGLGLVYVTAVVSIAIWFEKKRNLAVGLGACGTGVGTFIYAPMTQYFIEEYGWRGTILLLSGTLLNLCVCGCVMRDPLWWILEQKKQNNQEPKPNFDNRNFDKNFFNEDTSNITSRAYSPNHLDLFVPSRGKVMGCLIRRGVSPKKVISQEAASIRHELIKYHQAVLMQKARLKQRSQSVANLPTYMTSEDKITYKHLNDIILSFNKKYNVEIKPSRIVLSDPKERIKREITLDYNADYEQICESDHEYDELYEIAREDYERKKNKHKKFRKSKSESKEDYQLIKKANRVNKRKWLEKHQYIKGDKNPVLKLSKCRLRTMSCPDLLFKYKQQKKQPEASGCLADMFNVTLFKKMTFNCLCLGTIILFIWFIVPYFYLAEHMMELGYNDDDGAFMLSLIGITNTIGMVGLGWIGDFPQVSIGQVYAICLVVCGCTVALIPIAAPYYSILACVSAAFGLLFAASFTFTPNLLVTLVSLDEFTSAYGLVLLAQGIGHLIGPPLSGLIYDLTHSWDLAFYLAGGWIVVAGVLISFIPALKMYQRRREMFQEIPGDTKSIASMA